ETNFSLAHQLADGAGHDFDGDIAVDPVLVEQIDVIGAQTLQRGMHSVADASRTAVRSGDLAVFDLKSKFGGDGNFRTLWPECASKQFLVRVGAVDLRSIQEGATQFD